MSSIALVWGVFGSAAPLCADNDPSVPHPSFRGSETGGFGFGKAPPDPEIPAPPTKDPFFLWFFSWGQHLQASLPKGWRMRWEPSSLRSLGWLAGFQRGYRLIFEHETERIHVPLPHPTGVPIRDRLQLKPRLCSLHFYPRQGIYRAYESPILFPKPATLWAVSNEAVIFLPERFFAQEFPCPEVLTPLRRRLKLRPKRPLAPSVWKPLVGSLRQTSVWLEGSAVFLSSSDPLAPALQKTLLLAARRDSLCIHTRSSQTQEWLILHSPDLPLPPPLPPLRSSRSPKPRP